MIRIDQVWLAVDPLDMRAGFDTALGRPGTDIRQPPVNWRQSSQSKQQIDLTGVERITYLV
jgi:hypothetical protein